MTETIKALLRSLPQTSEYVFPSPATNATIKEAIRSLDDLSARLGNALATKTKTAELLPP